MTAHPSITFSSGAVFTTRKKKSRVQRHASYTAQCRGDLVPANDSADQGESEEDSYEKVREVAVVDRSVSLRNPILAWAHSRRAILIAALQPALDSRELIERGGSMCDYALMMVRSRLAVEGEELAAHRFRSFPEASAAQLGHLKGPAQRHGLDKMLTLTIDPSTLPVDADPVTYIQVKSMLCRAAGARKQAC
jgi:hypothetical protein